VSTPLETKAPPLDATPTPLRSAFLHRAFAAFTYRDFSILWFGAFTSTVGTWMQQVAQSWLVYELTQSSFYLGLDYFFGQLPILLLTLIGGVVADRHNRRHVLLGSQLVQMATAFSLTAIIMFDAVRVEYILLLSLVAGIGQAFGGPAYQALIPSLVEKKDLPNAIALNSIQFNLARVFGPLLAGATLAAFGTALCFALNGVSFLVVIVALLSLAIKHIPQTERKPILHDLKGGVTYVRSQPAIVALTVLAFLTTFLGLPLLTFLPIFARDIFHGGVGRYSVMMSFSGAGAVVGALIVAWLGRFRHMGLALLLVQLVFGGIIKFGPLTLPERELILLASALLAWATYRFVEIPIRFGLPSRRKMFGLGAGMAMIAVAGVAVIWGRGFDVRLPPEIRAMASVPTESFKWRVHECLLDLSHETTFADTCVERDRRPLVLIWGDSVAGALLPGLRKAQETRNFGIAQLTSSSCIPALNADIVSTPNCRAMNDKVFSLVRQIRPDIVLLHGTWEKHLDNVAETVVALKKQTNARVVVLGAVPAWRRGLPSEVLRYFMLHRALIPERSPNAAPSAAYDAVMRTRLEPLGAEFISASDVFCNAQGCLTRIGEAAADITVSDQVHITEKGSVFLIASIVDRMLAGAASASKPK